MLKCNLFVVGVEKGYNGKISPRFFFYRNVFGSSLTQLFVGVKGRGVESRDLDVFLWFWHFSLNRDIPKMT